MIGSNRFAATCGINGPMSVPFCIVVPKTLCTVGPWLDDPEIPSRTDRETCGVTAGGGGGNVLCQSTPIIICQAFMTPNIGIRYPPAKSSSAVLRWRGKSTYLNG